VNVSDGATIQVGSIEVGRNTTGVGTLNVTGPDTMITLFGRDDNSRGASEGVGVMNILNGALVYFDSRATLNENPSTFVPKITLGTGDSVVSGSSIVGAVQGVVRDPVTGEYVAEPYNVIQINRPNSFIRHDAIVVDGYTIQFTDSGLVSSDVTVDVDDVLKTITVTKGEGATYNDIITALNTELWADGSGISPVEHTFHFVDEKGNPINSSAVAPLNMAAVKLGEPT